jgi:hypothetical protein
VAQCLEKFENLFWKESIVKTLNPYFLFTGKAGIRMDLIKS